MSARPSRYRSDLNFAIEQKFREAGIEIAFPQRDLHIRSGVLKVEGIGTDRPANTERTTSIAQGRARKNRGSDKSVFSARQRIVRRAFFFHGNWLRSSDSQGIAKIVTLTELQNCDAWERAFQNKCKDHRYYEIVDETLDGDFEHHYLVLEDDSGAVRAVQPVFFVRQNLVEGVRGKIRSVVDLIRERFPRFLTMRVLMVGCAAGAGDLGACDEKDEAWLAKALSASLRMYARQNRASLVVLKDFPARYRPTLESFSSNGYTRIPSMPMTRLRYIIAIGTNIFARSARRPGKICAANSGKQNARARSTWS